MWPAERAILGVIAIIVVPIAFSLVRGFGPQMVRWVVWPRAVHELIARHAADAEESLKIVEAAERRGDAQCTVSATALRSRALVAKGRGVKYETQCDWRGLPWQKAKVQFAVLGCPNFQVYHTIVDGEIDALSLIYVHRSRHCLKNGAEQAR